MTALYVTEFDCSKADVQNFLKWTEEYKQFVMPSGKCSRIEVYQKMAPATGICVLEYWDSFAAHTELNVQFMNESDTRYLVMQACIGAPRQKKYLLHK